MSEHKEEKKAIQLSVSKRSVYLAGAALFIFAVGFLFTILILPLFPKTQTINRSEYQAVYLSNGQMYFGKLQNTSGDYLYLSSPYMPQNTPSGASSDIAGTIGPVKNEVWGPEDSIAIRTTQVVFWQNLRSDSKITKAIQSNQGQ